MKAVAVNSEDLRLVCEYLATFPYDHVRRDVSEALNRLADTVPEWEPGPRLTERYCRAMHPGHGVSSHITYCDARVGLKALHAAGLLREDS